MKSKIHLFHGSMSVIRKPQFGFGKTGNDFGLGFYCTENEELAKEWGSQPGQDGFANAYELDAKGLNFLHLNSPDFTVLHWMSVLVRHRRFRLATPIAKASYQYLRERFPVDVESCDVITGYRADDSYFDFAEAFLNNTISVEQLSRALQLGKLGEQIVIKSERAFGRLRFLGYSVADHAVHYPKRKSRDEAAGRAFEDIQTEMGFEGLYMNEILVRKIGADDARIPRNTTV